MIFESGTVYPTEHIAKREGDDPELPELLDIDASWKAGRDGSEPGDRVELMEFTSVP